MKELNDLDAVKDYRFITQQLEELDGESEIHADPNGDVYKLKEENKFLKFKIDKVETNLNLAKG